MLFSKIDDAIDGIDIAADDFEASVPVKRVPNGDFFEASRAGDVHRLRCLLDSGVNVNGRDEWDSAALYYACLAGHLDAARMLLESGAICSERTFDGDRCHYAALNLKVRKLLKLFEARPPPLGPLQAALRDTFLSSVANRPSCDEHINSDYQVSGPNGYGSGFPPDITFHIQGRHIEAHRAILSARSPFFKQKFETDWNNRGEVKLSKERLSYPALYSLIHFFYSDRLEIAVSDVEGLIRICKVCGCEELQKNIEKEMIHQKYAEYKSLRSVDSSLKRFIIQGSSLPEKDQLHFSLGRILQISLKNSTSFMNRDCVERLAPCFGPEQVDGSYDHLSDVLVSVGESIFPCHQVVLASRSAYFKARLTHIDGFIDNNSRSCYKLPFIVERGLSVEGFQKLIEYMYTDRVSFVRSDMAEELFDAASRYLLFPMKRAVCDALMPYLEMLAPAELCHWLILSDIYGVSKIRDYCLDVMASHFDSLANTKELREMLLAVPPPSGESSFRTSIPRKPVECTEGRDGNILDDLREKWLQVEAGGLDTRDQTALLFDKRLFLLIHTAKHEHQIS